MMPIPNAICGLDRLPVISHCEVRRGRTLVKHVTQPMRILEPQSMIRFSFEELGATLVEVQRRLKIGSLGRIVAGAEVPPRELDWFDAVRDGVGSGDVYLIRRNGNELIGRRRYRRFLLHVVMSSDIKVSILELHHCKSSTRTRI